MRIADHSVTRAILERHGFTFKIFRSEFLMIPTSSEDCGYC